MICKNCGAEIEDGLVFCTQCGSKQEGDTAKTCPDCGTPIEDGVQFCTQCGRAVGEKAETGTGAAEADGTAETGTQEAEQSGGFCINCGAPLAAGSAFCTNCSAPVPGAVAKPAPARRAVSKRLITIVAAIAAVGIVSALGMAMVNAMNPRSALIKAYSKTSQELVSAKQQLKKNVLPLNILSSNIAKANTQTFQMELDASDGAWGSMGYVMEIMKPELKIESDYAGKLLYANANVMGGEYILCAKDSLIGISAPVLYGDKVFTVDTKTLGDDLMASSMYDPYYMDDMDLSGLSFTIFDKPERIAEAFTEVGLGSTDDDNKLQADIIRILKKAAGKMEIEKGVKVKVDFESGETVDGKEYEVIFSDTLQKELLIDLIDTFADNPSGRVELERRGVYEEDIEEAKEEIEKLRLSDLTALVTVDNKGRMVGISTKFAPEIGTAVSIELWLTDYETLANGVELKTTMVTPYDNVILALTSQGNHTGKDGDYENEIQLRMTIDDETMMINLSSSYESDKTGGDLNCSGSVNVPGETPVAFKVEGRVDADKGNKSIKASIDKISLSGQGISIPTGLKIKYSMTSGVSEKAKKFFDKANKVMVLECTPEELREMEVI